MFKKGLIQQIQDYFSQKSQVVAVYLYGSQARGEAKKTSDIDLGVVLKKNAFFSTLFIPQIKFAQELSELLGKEVEVQDLTSCSLEFAHRVLSEGKLLYSADLRKRIEFETTIVGKYFDLKPALEEYYRELQEIAKKGELHVRYFTPK